MKPTGLIIVPIVAKTFEEAKDQIRQCTADAVEIRLDALDDTNPINQKQMRELAELAKVVVTDRRAYEGGLKTQTDTQRFDTIHAAIEAKPWAVDIEIQSPKLFRLKLIKLARQNGVKVISSYHNFKRTPPFDKLDEMVKTALSKTDYAKIACLPQNDDDITALLDLIRKHPGRVAAFGLGDKPVQKHTRILSLQLGAPFGYALGHLPAGTGQMTAEQMREELSKEKTGKQKTQQHKEKIQRKNREKQ